MARRRLARAATSPASMTCMGALPNRDLEAERDFYRRQLAVAFRYSREFYEPLGTVAEQIADTPGLDSILQECPPGSLEAARRIGETAVVLLTRVPTIPLLPSEACGDVAGVRPWWRDLLNYERACFLQLATTAEGPPANRPRRGVSALCMNFGWRVPAVVQRIMGAEAVTEELRQPVTLLFARQSDGTPCVVEVGPNVERVFRATNGLKTPEQIAAAAGLSLEETAGHLEALAGIGAVVLAMSRDEMARLIKRREKQ